METKRKWNIRNEKRVDKKPKKRSLGWGGAIVNGFVCGIERAKFKWQCELTMQWEMGNLKGLRGGGRGMKINIRQVIEKEHFKKSK